MDTRKAVILARGMGTRMQKDDGTAALEGQTAQLASKGLKGLIPIHGRPFLDYVIGELLEAGLTEIGLVVGPGSEELRAYGADVARRSGATVGFAVQEEALGTANAVWSARTFVGDEPFVMINSDNCYGVEPLRALCQADTDFHWTVGYERDALIAGSQFPPDRVSRFAVIQIGPGDTLERIVEKPERPEDYAADGRVYVSMNCFRFLPEVFDACARIEPDPVRGEYEIPAAVQALVDGRPTCFRVVRVEQGIVDMTGRGDISGTADALAQRTLPF